MEIDPSQAVQTMTTKLEEWYEGFFAMLPNLVVAVLVVLAFWVLARLARSVVGRAMDRATDNRALRGLLMAVTGIAVLGLGIFIALGVLKLDKTVAALLGGAGILALALGFAFQDIAENFMSGVLLSLRRPFRVGELVELSDYTGTVREIDLRSTLLQLPTGEQVLIPNSEVYGNPMKNYSRAGERRVDLACGVSYGDDLDEAEQVALAAVRQVAGRDREREPELFYTGFGGSSVDFVVRFWILETAQGAWLAARSEAIRRIHGAFGEHGIDIPFPITTLDFGIKGGEPLREQIAAGG